MTPERRARVLLALGAAAGLAMAALGLVTRGRTPDALPQSAVASVNGVAVAREDYLRALGALATDRRGPIDDADKRHVLDRLIDEELLLQRGVELGLVRRDRAVRSQLVGATMELLATGTADPSREELVAFYEAHRDWFTEPGRLRVRQVLVRVAGGDEAPARARADEAMRRLRAGEPFATVHAALGDEEVAPLPDALLPPTKLREYVGETATRTVLDQDVGTTSDPVRSSMGFHVLQIAERTAAVVPPFEEIEDHVRAEVRRRADETSLRASLDALRRAADVRVTDALP
ncbi:MAG: peptidyl-prolyl cis-trans isomerase [Candidatus Binatia bacterium]